MNAMKGRKLDEEPTSAGRVSGFGLNMKVGEYYGSDTKSRKMRRVSGKDKAEVAELKRKVEELEKAKVKAEEAMSEMPKLMEEMLKNLMTPNFLEGVASWNAKCQVGPYNCAHLHRQQLEQEPAAVAGNSNPAQCRDAAAIPVGCTRATGE